MECLPAIDVRAGRCVRLLRGDFAAETVYGDPLEQALAFVGSGARALHVVDLDAARTGEPVNRAVVVAIIEATGVPVQVGGGIRSAPAADGLLEAGAARVVLGTAALEQPELVRRLAEAHPGRIALGLDHRRVGEGSEVRRLLAARGWEEGSDLELADALRRFAPLPLGAVVVTDIGRDGTLAGPDLDGYALALGASALPIVASGGIGGASDLRALAALEVAGRRLAGAVVGRALLSGALGVAEAVAACGA